MAVSVTVPRAVNELGGPVIPGSMYEEQKQIFFGWHGRAGGYTKQ